MTDNNPIGVYSLLFAMLERAIVDYLSPSTVVGEKNKAAIEEKAFVWIFDQTDDMPYTFSWTCLHLGLDPQSLKDTLTSFKADNIEIKVTGHKMQSVFNLFLEDLSHDSYEVHPFYNTAQKRCGVL